MKIKGKFTSFHISVAAMMFTGYFWATDNYTLMAVAIGIVFVERLIVQFLIWYARMLMAKLTAEMTQKMNFQVEEIGKAMIKDSPYDQDNETR